MISHPKAIANLIFGSGRAEILRLALKRPRAAYGRPVQGRALRIQCLATPQDYSTSRKVVLSRSLARVLRRSEQVLWDASTAEAGG